MLDEAVESEVPSARRDPQMFPTTKGVRAFVRRWTHYQVQR
jgi:hypothetical protein